MNMRILLFPLLLLVPISAQEPPKLPAIATISVEESKTLKDLGKDAENADLRAQLLAERIRTAQVELEKLQQASKEAAERVRQAMRVAAEKAGVPPGKLENYDLSEEKGQFVLKLKGPPPRQ